VHIFATSYKITSNQILLSVNYYKAKRTKKVIVFANKNQIGVIFKAIKTDPMVQWLRLGSGFESQVKNGFFRWFFFEFFSLSSGLGGRLLISYWRKTRIRKKQVWSYCYS
jgi:hypothetical protein